MRQIRESNIEQMTTISGEIRDHNDSEETRMLKRIRDAEGMIAAIADIIYMQMPLEYQDAWLDSIRKKGMWQPDPEIEEGAKDGNDKK